ncbi:PIN domain-containing protein, partial [Chromobacterium vaccinii]|nr:PIN domain-containing protein [Chromobacterium vaccinii]
MCDKEYDTLLIDASTYIGNALRLEKGLLGKLTQFKRSPIIFLIPDVIKNEVKKHLEMKIKAARAALEKSLNEAGDHLFFDGSALNDAKKSLIDSQEIEELADSRLENFIVNTGAMLLECGKYVSVSSLLGQYFSNLPPFAESGSKKCEFPDAIVLMAIEKWADSENKCVLAVSNDGDWKRYCETSSKIDCENNLGVALDKFNKQTAPYALLDKLEQALKMESAQSFLLSIEDKLKNALDGFTPDQEADSHFYWEPDGSHGWFKAFHLINYDFNI